MAWCKNCGSWMSKYDKACKNCGSNVKEKSTREEIQKLEEWEASKQKPPEKTQVLRASKLVSKGVHLVTKNPIILVPALLLMGFSSALYALSLSVDASLQSVLLSFGLFLLLATYFMNGWTIKLGYDIIQGKKTSLSSSARFVFSRFWKISVANILFFILAFVGYAVFIIPGIFISIKLWLCIHLIIIEDTGPIESLRRSWKITTLDPIILWNLFLLWMISMIIELLLFVILPSDLQIFFGYMLGMLIAPLLFSSLTYAYLQLTESR